MRIFNNSIFRFLNLFLFGVLLLFCKGTDLLAQKLEFVGQETTAKTIEQELYSKNFNYQFQLRASGAADINSIIVEITDFTSEASTVTAKINGDTSLYQFDLKGNTDAILTLTATFNVSGVYLAWLKWKSGDTLETRIIKVIRKKKGSGLSIVSPSQFASDKFRVGKPYFYVEITDTSGFSDSVYPPNIIGLTHTVAENTAVQGDLMDIKVFHDGKQKDHDKLVGITDDDNERFKIVLSGLSPGVYSGKVHMKVPDAQPLIQDIKIYVRRCWLFAALIIAIGVCLSQLLRTYVKESRPLYLKRRVALLVRDKISRIITQFKDLTPLQKNVLTELKKQISIIYSSLAINITLEEGGKYITEIESRLNYFAQWYQLDKEVIKIKPGKLKLEVIKLLKEFGNQIIADAKLEKAKDMPSLLTTIEDKINAAIQFEINAKLDKFLAELEGEKALPSSDTKYVEQLTELITSITEIKTLVEGNEFDLARSGYDAVLLNYAKLGSLRLEGYLYNKVNTLFGFSDKDWQNFSEQLKDQTALIRNKIIGQEAIREYRRTYKIYALGITNKALEKAGTLGFMIASLPRTTSQEIDIVNAYEINLELVKSQLKDALRSIENFEMARFNKFYKEGVKAASGIENRLKGNTLPGVVIKQFSVDGATKTFRTYLPFAWENENIKFDQTSKDPSLESIDRKARLSENWFTFALIAVAVVLGLYLFYIPDLSWGTSDDIFKALLWGLGLHTLTAETAFGGVGFLRQEYSKPPE